jgi:hypothetical protein
MSGASVLANTKPKSHWRHSVEPRGASGQNRHRPGEIPPLRGGGKSAEAIVAVEGRTNKKASRCEGPKDRTEPTTALDQMTKERTKQRGATIAVATLDWQTTGRRPKAPNRSECSVSPVCVPGKEDLWTGQPPDAENRTSGGVGGCRGAIPGTRPDRGDRRGSCSSWRFSPVHRRSASGSCDQGADTAR